MNRTKSYLLTTVLLLLVMAVSSFAQLATIVNRETADPTKSGYAKWIKIQVKGSTLGGDNLNDQFTGVSFLVDLNFDGNDNETNPSDAFGWQDTYSVSGDSIVTSPPGVAGGERDAYFYIPIRKGRSPKADSLWEDNAGYNTAIRPRVMLVNAGALRVGSFELALQIDSGFRTCDDGIKPTIRHAYYYDDGAGGKTAFDGYVDRVDLIWSEDMRTSNTLATPTMFSGLVSAETHIQSLVSVGDWNGTKRRFTIFVNSADYNTGISGILTYVPPPGEADKFREASSSQKLHYAESNSLALTDKAGPVIVRAKTKRAMRRQPLASALTSRQIEVTFSESVNIETIDTGDTDFEIYLPAGDEGTNPISAIISSTSSNVLDFQLTNNFPNGNVTGTIQFMADSVVKDLLNNYNGLSNAAMPPGRPAPSRGAMVTIQDGILPNILAFNTVDALPSELGTGGLNGWGVLDYLEVVFDHAMDPSRTSTEGFSVSGTGIAGMTGSVTYWSAAYDTVRLRLIATTPKIANTGVVPVLSYYNPGVSNGFRDFYNQGLCEDLYATDTILSSNNGYALQARDKAGPALIKAFTAGKKRIRMVFSEKVNTAAWPTSPASNSRFKWFVNGSLYNGVNVYYSGLSGSGRDSVVYLNHMGTEWTKLDSGAINFFNPNVVRDVASTGNNGNTQWDDDYSLSNAPPSLLGSDVPVKRDDIAPKLLQLETVDRDYDGKLDHLRLVFDPESPVYPIKSFRPANWTITGYDGTKQNLGVDLSVYPGSPDYVDTVEVYIRFNETIGSGPSLTPYGGDTGDILYAQVAAGLGFADWADNVMRALPDPLMPVRDKAGPAIMAARTISTNEVQVDLSEDIDESTLGKWDFYLNMGVDYEISWVFDNVAESSPGRVWLHAVSQSWWLPNQEGLIRFYPEQDGKVYDLVGNVNQQTASFTVRSHSASQFDISLVPDGQIYRGVPFTIEVIARDRYGNVDENFPEQFTLSSNLSQDNIDLPDGLQRLHNGIGYFTITSYQTTSNLLLTLTVKHDSYDRFYTTSDPFTVIDPTIDAPNRLTVTDVPGDQGGFVNLTWDFSANHPGFGVQPAISFYEIFFEQGGKIYTYTETITATDTTGTARDSMRVKLFFGNQDSARFWVRAVWDPSKTISALSATASDGWLTLTDLHPVLLRDRGRPVISGKRTSDATLAAVQSEKLMSGTVMGSGRAIDNIPPKKPAAIAADKAGVTVQLHWRKVTDGINNTPELFGVRYQLFSHGTKAHFDPETEGELVITTADTAFSYNGPELRKYFCVRAIDSDNESEITNRVGKYGFTINRPTVPTQTAYTYLSLPLINSTLVKASQVASSVGSVVAVVKLDSTTNRFSKVFIPGISRAKDDFTLNVGAPVLVAVNHLAAEDWFMTGAVPDPASIHFTINRSAAGKYTEITLPLDKLTIQNASGLAAAIGGVRAVLKLDPAKNRFSQVYIPGISRQTENFSIAPGEPVLINASTSAPATWPQ